MLLRPFRIALRILGLSLLLCPMSVLVNGQFDTALKESPEAISLTAAKDDPRPRRDASSAPPLEWRRTTNGWEPTAAWHDLNTRLTPPPSASSLHPTIVAMLQVLLSVGALLLFEHTGEDESTDLIHMLVDSDESKRRLMQSSRLRLLNQSSKTL